MSLNETPSGERLHIGFFGMRNAGKSSVVNAVTGQNLSLVSDVKGTTTDPVQKAMELLPVGPVVIIDTPGMDDEGALGEMRVQRAKEVLRKTDLAILVVDATVGLRPGDCALKKMIAETGIPLLTVFNKSDLLESVPTAASHEIYVSAATGAHIHALKEKIAQLAPQSESQRVLVGDLIHPNDVIILVTPIDESAPKGRMILPQQQMIRDILDHSALNVVVRETELADALQMCAKPPRMVITDSQAFGVVSKIVPDSVPLTSFSILFARYKGELETVVRGAAALDRLQDGDRVLISEGCTHHRQCNDIGTVKLPRWIQSYTGRTLRFDYTSGREFPADLSPYALVVHCGACMLNAREMQSRLRCAAAGGVPITNYGIAIAQIHGILRRSLSPFPDLLHILNESNRSCTEPQEESHESAAYEVRRPNCRNTLDQ